MGYFAIGAGIVAEKTGALSPKSPKLPPTVPMPDQNAIDEARRKSIAQQQLRTGRASTILSASSDAGASDKLGP